VGWATHPPAVHSLICIELKSPRRNGKDRLILSRTSVCHGEQPHELGKRSLGKKITVIDPEPGVAIADAHERAFRLLLCAVDPNHGDDALHIAPRLESGNRPVMINILGRHFDFRRQIQKQFFDRARLYSEFRIT